MRLQRWACMVDRDRRAGDGLRRADGRRRWRSAVARRAPSRQSTTTSSVVALDPPTTSPPTDPRLPPHRCSTGSRPPAGPRSSGCRRTSTPATSPGDSTPSPPPGPTSSTSASPTRRWASTEPSAAAPARCASTPASTDTSSCASWVRARCRTSCASRRHGSTTWCWNVGTARSEWRPYSRAAGTLRARVGAFDSEWQAEESVPVGVGPVSVVLGVDEERAPQGPPAPARGRRRGDRRGRLPAATSGATDGDGSAR